MTSFDTILDLAGRHSGSQQGLVLPVVKRLSADLLTPVSAFLSLRETGSHPFLLESVEGGEKLARYSFLGKDPHRIVSSTGTDVTVQTRDETGAFESTSESGSILDVVQSIVSEFIEIRTPGLPRLTGGAVGYLGYDCIRLIEDIPQSNPADLTPPDSCWCFYDTLAAFDRVKHQLVLISNIFYTGQDDLQTSYDAATKRIDSLERDLTSGYASGPEAIALTGSGIASNFTADAFKSAVETAKEHIFEGDIFQVVLSQRFELGYTGDAFNLYRALRQVNPSPYMYYLDYGDFKIVGSSPEVLVRTDGGRAELLPIAGTRKRGATPDEDLALEKDLLADPKELAEHVMLVDLGRNDLGRVCDFGSVHVDRYGYVERYSHVMHIVSSVSGDLADSQRPMDVLKACFPAGTVSGAPKVRAMEIIDHLEPTRRGIYSGAIGYIDYSGNMDTCIAIRTMVVTDHRLYIQAGAGIVADSNPQSEFEETENKARALKQAIEVAAEGLL